MHTGPGNLVAIRCAVMYYARAAHAFSAGIKCWHCKNFCGNTVVKGVTYLSRIHAAIIY